MPFKNEDYQVSNRFQPRPVTQPTAFDEPDVKEPWDTGKDYGKGEKRKEMPQIQPIPQPRAMEPAPASRTPAPRAAAPQPTHRPVQPVCEFSGKSKTVVLLLCIFLGIFGVHRFYVGKIGTGLINLLTNGVMGLGWILDMILIAGGTFEDKQGRVLC